MLPVVDLQEHAVLGLGDGDVLRLQLQAEDVARGVDGDQDHPLLAGEPVLLDEVAHVAAVGAVLGQQVDDEVEVETLRVGDGVEPAVPRVGPHQQARVVHRRPQGDVARAAESHHSVGLGVGEDGDHRVGHRARHRVVVPVVGRQHGRPVLLQHDPQGRAGLRCRPGPVQVAVPGVVEGHARGLGEGLDLLHEIRELAPHEGQVPAEVRRSRSRGAAPARSPRRPGPPRGSSSPGRRPPRRASLGRFASSTVPPFGRTGDLLFQRID